MTILWIAVSRRHSAVQLQQAGYDSWGSEPGACDAGSITSWLLWRPGREIPSFCILWISVVRFKHIPAETMAALTSYPWPGNIRELQNLIERAVILSDDGVLPNSLPMAGTQAVAISSATTLKDSERALILHTLQGVGWVIGGPKGAATKLGGN